MLYLGVLKFTYDKTFRKSSLYFPHHAICTPRTADVILFRAETIKSFAIYLAYMLDYFH